MVRGTNLGVQLGRSRGNDGRLGVMLGRKQLLYAITSFSVANYYATQNPGGEAGVATGFGSIGLLAVDTLGVSRYLLSRANGAGALGHMFWLNNSDVFQLLLGNDAGVSVASNTFQLKPSDVGRVLIVLGWHDGTRARLAVNALPASVTGTAITGYTPYASASVISGYAFPTGQSAPAPGVRYLAHATFRGTPSDTQLQQLISLTRAAGDLPATFPLTTAGDADIAALAPAHWYRADTYALSGGNLATLTNRGSAGGALSVTAGTLAEPAVDASFGGQRTIAFTGSQKLTSGSAASAFKFLHDGTGAEAFVVFVNDAPSATDRYILATSTASTTQVGYAMLARGPASDNVAIYVPNGSGQSYYEPIPNTASGTPLYIHSTLKTGLTPQAGRGTALNNFTAAASFSSSDPTQTLTIGTNTGTAYAIARVADVLLFPRILSAAEREVVRDYIRVRYGIGVVTLTHRWSLRDALAGLSVVDGQTAPASLPDTVTGAAADAMTRTGSPIVRAIDTSIDGRRTYGAMGWSTSAYLYLAALATSAVTGFHFVIRVRFDLGGSASTRMIIDASSGTTGFQVLCNGATVASGYAWLRTWDGSGVQVDTPTSVGMLATGGGADGGVIYLSGYFDPATNRIEFFTNKTRQTTGAVCTGHSAGNAPLYVGGRPSGLTPYTQTIMDVSYGRTPLTAGEIATMIDASEAAGYLVDVPGKTLYRWPITQAVIAAGGPSAGIPAQVQDRVGTDHLTRVGGLVVDDGALRGFSARDFVASTPAGGLKGAASGHWVEILVNKRAFATDQMVYASGSGSSANGVQINIYNGALYVAWGSGSGSVTATPQYALTDGSHHICVLHNGTSGVVYVDGVQRETTTPFTPVAAPATSPNVIGVQRSDTGAFPATVETIYGVAGGDSVPSAGEVAAASVYALANKKVGGIAGKTDKRYSIVDDVIEAGGKVPALIKERVSNVDHMVVVGAPLQVAQRVERLYSWEAA